MSTLEGTTLIVLSIPPVSTVLWAFVELIKEDAGSFGETLNAALILGVVVMVLGVGL